MATNDDGRLNIQFTADDKSLKRAIRDNTAGMEEMAREAEKEGGKIDETFKRLGASVAAFFSIQQAAGMARQIALVRGQYQQLEVAFETMLQSQEKSVELMEQLTKTAATTPFGLEDVTQGAKQLLAYGFAAKDVNQTLIDLGNIAAGLSVPLNDLVYLYGTTMTQGRVYTQDMRQFMGRGIPLAEELAKQFGVTKDEVSALVTAGKVGFPEVEKAIKAMSGEGGKFYNLMEKQSHTITGQISNIEDAFQMMLNDIGKQSEGVINKTLEITSSLIENYEKIGKILADVVATYGIYKAAVIAGSAAQAIASQAALGYSAAEMVQYKALLLCEKAQKAFNKSILANPYVMVAAAVLGLTAAVVKLTTHTNAAKKAQKELYDVQMDAVNGLPFDKEYRKEARSLDYLKDKLESAEKGSRQWNEARDEIVKDFGKYDDTLGEELDRTGKLGEAYDKLKSAIEETARARMYNAYVTRNEAALNSELDETLSDVEKRMKNYFRDGERGGYTAGSAFAAVSRYIMGETKELDSFLKSVLDSSFRVSTSRVNDARKAVEELDGLEEKARSVFGYYKKEAAKVEDDDPTPDDPKKDPEKVLDARYKALKAMEAFGEKEAESRKNIQNKINDAEIDGMRDGLQKTLAQLYENFEREREEIEKQEKETLKLIQEAEKEKWLAADPEKRKERDFKPDTTELPTKWANLYQKLYDALYNANMKAQEDAIKASERMEEDAMNQYLSQYGAYEEKRAAIAAIYDEKIRQSREDGDSEYVQKTLEQQKAAALSNLDMANESTYRMIFGDPAKMTKSTIEAAIDAAKKKLRELNKDANPQEWESLVNAVERLEGARDTMDMESIQTGWENVLKSAVLIRREEERINGLKADGVNITEKQIELAKDQLEREKQDLSKSVAVTAAIEYMKALQMAAQAMKEIARASHDAELEEGAEVLAGVAQNFLAAAQGFASSGSWIGAVVAGVTDAIGQLANALTDVGVRSAKALDSLLNYKKAIQSLAYENDYESIFGVDALASLKNSYDAARNALENYQRSLTFYSRGEIKTDRGYVEQVNGMFGNIQDAVVAWGRSRGKRSTLGQMFPDIFDDEGNIVLDKAKAALDNYVGSTEGKFGDEGYERLKAAVEYLDEYESRMKEVDDYIRNAFGNMSDDLADAILQGADAFRVLEKSSADFLNSYMRDLLKSMLITEELKSKYTDRIREAVVSGDASALAGVLSDFNEEMTANIEAAQIAVETWQKAAAEAGIDTSLSLDDTSRGIAQASQDSVDELNGRFTAIQGHTANIEAQTRALAQNAASILEQVMGIHRDTTDMAGQLAAIRRDVATIKDNQ